ncbi:MAG TPA: PEP-CTERM sorting domain-containing protein [Geobacteraceae bacterium]
MRKTILLLAATILTYSSTALAIPTTTPNWTDTITTNVLLDHIGATYTYTHDITDGPNGFVPNPNFPISSPGQHLDTVSSFQLIVDLDNITRTYQTTAFVNIVPSSLNINDGFYNFTLAEDSFGASLAGILSLDRTGTLTIKITDLQGQFWLDNSTLNVWGCATAPNAPVPEPGTFVLVGAGLLGLAIYGKRRMKE